MNKKRTSLLLCWLLAILTVCAQEKATHKVSPLLPRFLREGDRPLLGFLLQNISKQDWSGTASLSLVDEANQPVDGWFFNSLANQYFTIDADSAATIYFPIEVPFQFNHKTNWKLQVQSGDDSASMQGAISILPWNYEDASQTDPLSSASVSVRKKYWQIAAEGNKTSRHLIEEYTTVHTGDMIAIQLILDVKQNISLLKIQDGWGAGLEPKGPAKILSFGSNMQKTPAKIQFNCNDNVEKNGKEMIFSNLIPGIYTLEYQTTAVNAGTFNQPPALIYLGTNTKESARSIASKINIE